MRNFFSFEGINGAGKSTQAKLLVERLQAEGHPIMFVREPGGTLISEMIRSILKSDISMSRLCRLLLFNAARADLLEQEILPALQSGKIVIADRYVDSTYAYQEGCTDTELLLICGMTCKSAMPQRTFYIDIDPETAEKRTKAQGDRDRVTVEQTKVFRERYYRRIAIDPKRWSVWDGGMAIMDLHEHIYKEFMREVAS